MATKKKNPPGSKSKKTNLDPEKMASALELMGMSPELMNAALANAGEVYDQGAGNGVPDFSEDDQRMLNVLQGQVARNQPVQAARGVGTLLPNNEFATSMRGLSSGVQNLAASLVNEGKLDELYGDPDKVQNFTARSQEKLNRATELRDVASKLGEGGSFEWDGEQVPGFSQEAIQEMLADAEKLEEEANNDMMAADQSRGVLGQARDLEQQQAEAQAGKQDRAAFIQKFGEATYEGALAAQKSADAQKAITDRAILRQDALNKRNTNEWKQRLGKARIDAQAKVDVANAKNTAESGSKWPLYTDPEYVRDFIPVYQDIIDEQISVIEAEMYHPSYTNRDGSPKLNTDVTEAEVTELTNKKTINELLTEIDSDAVTYGYLKENGLKYENVVFNGPTPDQMAVLDFMKEAQMPPEMIEAYKFYNGIKLTMPPPKKNKERVKSQNSQNLDNIFTPTRPVGEDGMTDTIRRKKPPE